MVFVFPAGLWGLNASKSIDQRHIYGTKIKWSKVSIICKFSVALKLDA